MGNNQSREIVGAGCLTMLDIVIEVMPFSDQIIKWCSAHPEFREALKLANADRFIALGMVQTSRPPASPEDEVVGFTAYDFIDEIFKQDFIVDIGSSHTKFMLYSKLPSKNYGKYVQSIKGFYVSYGQNDSYKGEHHSSLEQIDALGSSELSQRARRAMAKGKLLKQSGRKEVSQAELQETMAQIKEAKKRV